MYRPTRSTNPNTTSGFPFVFAISTFAALAVGMACSAERDEPKTDTAIAPKPAVAQNLESGVIVPSFVGQPTTFAAGESAYRKKNYREAVEMFGGYVQRHPKNAYGHYMLGLSAWKSGDLDGARGAFEQALSLDSTNVKTLLNLGRVLLDQGRSDDAFVRVSAAVTLDSGSAEVHRMMGRVQSSREKRDSAIASYRVALSLDPADSWSMNNLGLLLIEQGRYEEALSPLARAVELRPESPAFANNLGVALERTGHSREAADAFRSALAADSTYAKAARSLARVEGKQDDSTTTVDVKALAAAFNEEIQKARETRLAKVVVKPDGVR
jgi:Tfp pilus assembly protein PilF